VHMVIVIEAMRDRGVGRRPNVTWEHSTWHASLVVQDQIPSDDDDPLDYYTDCDIQPLGVGPLDIVPTHPCDAVDRSWDKATLVPLLINEIVGYLPQPVAMTPDANLREHGLSSRNATRLAFHLQEWSGFPLPSDLLVQSVSVVDIAEVMLTMAEQAPKITPELGQFEALVAIPDADSEYGVYPHLLLFLQIVGIAVHAMVIVLCIWPALELSGWFGGRINAQYLSPSGKGIIADNRSAIVVASPLSFVVFILSTMLATTTIKWCVLGRLVPGSIPIGGLDYFRWWFVRSVNVFPIYIIAPFIQGTCLINL
jgi:acyl carrier protein